MVMHNTHQPTEESRQRVSDLVMCGTPIYLISEVIDIMKPHFRSTTRRRLRRLNLLLSSVLARPFTSKL